MPFATKAQLVEEIEGTCIRQLQSWYVLYVSIYAIKLCVAIY